MFDRTPGSRIPSCRAFALLALLLAAQALAACREQSSPAREKPARIGLSWDISKTQRYELRFSTLAELDGGPARTLVLQSGLELDLRGDAAKRQMLLRLLEPKLLDGSGKPAANTAALSSELGKEFGLELSGGVIQAYFEPSTAAVPVVGFRRHIAAALQFAEHAQAKTWQAREWDATGLSKVEYRTTSPNSWAWTKLGYERLLSNQQHSASLATADIMPKVAGATGRLVSDVSGIVSVERDETIVVRMAATTTLSTKLGLELRRSGFAPAKSAADWERSLKDLKRSEVGAPTAVANRELLDEARVGSHTFAEVVEKLSELEAKKGRGASAADEGPLFQALVGIFRTQPPTIDLAIERVRARSAISDTLLDALAMASSDDSLDRLSKLALDPALPGPVRLHAIGSFIRAKQPGQAALDRAIAMLDDPLLHENALYGLGSFVRQLRERGQTSAAASGAKALGQQLRVAKTPGDIATVLLAVSNSGSPELFEAAARYQRAPDADVRRAAIEAIRLMPQPAVETQLREVLGRNDRGDALAALHALGRRPRVSSESVERVKAIALKDPSPEIRREAVLALGFWSRSWPAVVPVLAQIRGQDPDPRVREVAKPVVAP